MWWAVPPLELYYLDAYYHVTLARKSSSGTTSVQWLYKSAPDRLEEIATESDVVADGPVEVSNYRVPMHLSTEARIAGWTALMQGPRENIKAAELEPYLRSVFYGGRSFWRLFEPIIWGVLFLLFASLGAREWIIAGTRRKRHLEAPDNWRQYLTHSGPNYSADGHAQWRLIRPLRRLLSVAQNLSMRRAQALLRATTKRSADFPLSEGTSALPNSAPEASARLASITGASGIEVPSKAVAEPVGFPPPSLRENWPRTEAQHEPSEHSIRQRKRHLIFPGEAGLLGTNERPADWDESQWID